MVGGYVYLRKDIAEAVSTLESGVPTTISGSFKEISRLDSSHKIAVMSAVETSEGSVSPLPFLIIKTEVGGSDVYMIKISGVAYSVTATDVVTRVDS